MARISFIGLNKTNIVHISNMIINTRVLTYGGDGGDNLSKLELVENSRLSGSVEPDHQDPHLLLAEETLHRSQVI